MDQNALKTALQDLAVTLGTNHPSEDDVEKGFVGVYQALGYTISGRDYRNKTRDTSGVPDVILHNSDRSIQVIVELKKPSENLDHHTQQLAEYMRSLAEAQWGLLSNGKQWRAYQRNGKAIDLIWQHSITELEANPLYLEGFERQVIEVTNFKQIETRLKKADGEALVPHGLTDLATQEFLFTFSLQEGSPFAALVGGIQDLLNTIEPTSAFVKGAYDFWKKVYARELDAEDLPRLWKDSKLPITATKEGLYRFSFALETAYTLTARLILAKAIQDKDNSQGIIKAHLAGRLLEHLKAKRNLRNDTLEPERYLEATELLFDDYARTLFTSIYAKDIFDWWRDYPSASDNTRRDFARAVADLEIALLRFDFRTMEGDLLGEMYQRYFDADTRKALGEFYTPKAVVDFILDEVGYDGDGTLLDPATGSGTFIVSALRRYLKKHENKDPLATLRGITEEFRLVAFDVNPFAVIMAQIGFATELITLYTKAIQKDPHFVLRRLPIVRTDSLRKETMEGAHEGGMLAFGYDELKVTLELPVKTEGGFLAVTVTFPHLETAKQHNMVKNVRDWLMALQSVFAAVEVLSQARDHGEKLPKLKTTLRSELAKRHPQPDALTDYLEKYANGVWETLLDLIENHGDGRFLKTLEDLMLGLVLKHYLRYQFVVGNPPYVRVQNIPETLRNYWWTRYDWVEKNFDIFMPFIERALHGSSTENGEEECWLEDGGVMGFIVPNRFVNVEYAGTFRAQLPRTATVRSITDFKAVKFKPNATKPAESIFAEASVYPAIIIAENTVPDADYEFRAARMYPTDALLEPSEALKAIRNAKTKGANSVRLTAGGREYADVFLERSANLQSDGWYLMPADERAVFDKLEAVGDSLDPSLPKLSDQTRRLRNYTATSSGGFQGVKTGKDEVFVLEEIPELKEEGYIWLYDAERNPVKIEREILKPFLFGEDMREWFPKWSNHWIIFPYFSENGKYLLMPSYEYWRENPKRKTISDHEPFKNYPDNPVLIDKMYPFVWKYLQLARIKLISRENGKYKTPSQEWRWYELSRPQNLEWNFVEKVIIQELANKAKVAIDHKGEFVISGARIYGIVLNKYSLDSFSGILGSRLIDFWVKQQAVIYGNGFYSYADQFIKDVPMLDIEKETRLKLKNLSKQLAEVATRLQKLEQQLEQFPESVTEALQEKKKSPDVDTFENMVGSYSPLPTELRHHPGARLETDLMGQTVLVIPKGKTGVTEIRGAPNFLQVVQRTLEQRGKISRTELLVLPIPEREKQQREYLDTLQRWKDELIAVHAEIQKLEAELNDAVYDAFGLDARDRAVIEDFLRRF